MADLGWVSRTNGEQDVKIETVSKTQGLNGGPEVWVHVFSNETLDWPRIEALLSDNQKVALAALGPKTLSYFPHNPTAEEKAEHGFLFDEFWVWASTNRKVKA